MYENCAKLWKNDGYKNIMYVNYGKMIAMETLMNFCKWCPIKLCLYSVSLP